MSAIECSNSTCTSGDKRSHNNLLEVRTGLRSWQQRPSVSRSTGACGPTSSFPHLLSPGTTFQLAERASTAIYAFACIDMVDRQRRRHMHLQQGAPARWHSYTGILTQLESPATTRPLPGISSGGPGELVGASGGGGAAGDVHTPGQDHGANTPSQHHIEALLSPGRMVHHSGRAGRGAAAWPGGADGGLLGKTAREGGSVNEPDVPGSGTEPVQKRSRLNTAAECGAARTPGKKAARSSGRVCNIASCCLSARIAVVAGGRVWCVRSSKRSLVCHLHVYAMYVIPCYELKAKRHTSVGQFGHARYAAVMQESPSPDCDCVYRTRTKELATKVAV